MMGDFDISPKKSNILKIDIGCVDLCLEMKFLYAIIFLASAMHVNSYSSAHILEVRTYNLKPGTRDTFHKIFEEESIPLLKEYEIEVVAYGTSPQDANTYYLIRRYTDIADMNSREERFYSSAAWKNGPRERVLSLIDNYTTLIVSEDLFRANRHSLDEDHKKLSALNKKFIDNFIHQDTVAHNEIIHQDFVCIDNSGEIMSRKRYMEDWSHSYSDGKFESFSYHDEHIRFFGNVALVRSRTAYRKVVNGKEIKGGSVYTDTYVKEDGRWWCVQAQITPLSAKP